MFSSSEYFDMIVLYGQCNESAAQEYVVRFPNREHPSRNTTLTSKINASVVFLRFF
jgi:hypothetical protein